MDEDEQAKSREEMTAWSEKQLQVAREEARLRQSMSHWTGKGDKNPQSRGAMQVCAQVNIYVKMSCMVDLAKILVPRKLSIMQYYIDTRSLIVFPHIVLLY